MPVSKRHHGQSIEFGDAVPATCSNALFGGNYYPGKDKRRPIRGGAGNKRTLGYRICCSSPPRVICFTLLWGYILICYVFTPLGRGMYQLGVRLLLTPAVDVNADNHHIRPATHITAGSHHSMGRYHNNNNAPGGHGPQQPQKALHKYKLNGDLTQLPTLEWERQREIDRRNHWDLHGKIPGQHSYEKLLLLSKTAPKWAHRNEKEEEATPDHRHDMEHVGNSNSKSNRAEVGNSNSNINRAEVGNSNSNSNRAEEDDRQNRNSDSNHNEDGSSQHLEEESIRTVRSMETDGSCPPLEAPPSVSIVIQSSLDRLWLVRETCRRWTNPIVLVVYYDPQIATEESPPWTDLVAECPHVKIVPFPKDAQDTESWQYPINQLRNAGLEALETSHFLVMDVDFIPSSTLQDSVLEHLPSMLESEDGGVTQALVVPAFDRKHGDCSSSEECQQRLQNDSSFIPSTFDEVKECARSKDCIVFQSDNNWDGHSSTKTKLWLDKNWYEEENKDSHPEEGAPAPTKKPRKIPCFDSFRYEPYVLLRWCPGMTPYYDERFYGYGKNKIEYISHLRFLGYSFSVLPEAYIVHHPHPESQAKTSWSANENDLHQTMDELYPQFLSELFELHGNPALRQCSRSKKKKQHHKPPKTQTTQ